MYEFEQLSYLNSPLPLKATLKAEVADFIVDEIMPIEMSGEGEHCWLHITKQSANTDFVATELANFVGVKPGAVSYAGLKDRHAITSQWFSVHLPGLSDPAWDDLKHDDFKINAVHRHSRKLKRGALSGNQFQIRLTNCQGDESLWQQRLDEIAQAGVPNYFGLQRFGHQMNNLHRAENLIANRKMGRLKPHKRGIFLSAMRSWIFNSMVSNRIAEGTFNQAIKGDVFMLADSHACFHGDDNAVNDAQELAQRLANNDLNLTAALWGRGQSMATDKALENETAVASQYSEFAASLEKAGMKQERRAMRLMPQSMTWEFGSDKSVLVNFELPKGSYATALLRELAVLEDAALPSFK